MNNRRSFIFKLGAGASAAVTATVGVVGAGKDAAENPALKAAVLEEEKVLRQFHQAYEQAMDKVLHEEVIALFADDAEVVFNGGIFRGAQGVSRLYRQHFQPGRSGKRMEAAPGFELTAEQQRDSLAVAADLRSATAVFPYSIQMGMPFETESSLASMARLHGEGVRTWWEGGVYKIAYRKGASGRWQMSRLEYDTLSRADYRPGKRYAQPISVARISTRFPADQQGADELVSTSA